jgi:hypothetical protein
MREKLITGTSFNWLRVLAEAGDPAYAKFGPEELFTKRFPDKLIVRSSPPEFCNPHNALDCSPLPRVTIS